MLIRSSESKDNGSSSAMFVSSIQADELSSLEIASSAMILPCKTKFQQDKQSDFARTNPNLTTSQDLQILQAVTLTTVPHEFCSKILMEEAAWKSQTWP